MRSGDHHTEGGRIRRSIPSSSRRGQVEAQRADGAVSVVLRPVHREGEWACAAASSAR